jgi:hypothetical protein
MRVISKKPLREFWQCHPESKSALEEWFHKISQPKIFWNYEIISIPQIIMLMVTPCLMLVEINTELQPLFTMINNGFRCGRL